MKKSKKINNTEIFKILYKWKCYHCSKEWWNIIGPEIIAMCPNCSSFNCGITDCAKQIIGGVK